MKLILVLAALAAVAVAEKSRYDFYRVYTVELRTEEQFKLMQAVQQEDITYDFLSEVDALGGTVDVMVPPHKRGEWSYFMEKHNFHHTIKVQNLQEKIDNEMPSIVPASVTWTAYHRLDDIHAFLDAQIRDYPGVVTGFNYGTSFEGRQLRGVRIQHTPNTRAVFIEANIHAREWISSATATYVINELLTSTNAEVRRMAQSYTWYIIPVANPDGYEFSHTNTRMWRKTRRPNNLGICTGTDPNRNFDFQWMVGGGASSNPCSETFAGPEAFSEPETLNMANFYRTIENEVGLFLSFHSFGQFVLYPYGHTTDPAPNAADLEAISSAFQTAVAGPFGTVYTFGQTSTHLYVASGASPDWAYSRGTEAAFTLEFRDTGTNGFQLPANQIIPNGQETMLGLIAMVDTSARLNYL